MILILVLIINFAENKLLPQGEMTITVNNDEDTNIQEEAKSTPKKPAKKKQVKKVFRPVQWWDRACPNDLQGVPATPRFFMPLYKSACFQRTV